MVIRFYAGLSFEAGNAWYASETVSWGSSLKGG